MITKSLKLAIGLHLKYYGPNVELTKYLMKLIDVVDEMTPGPNSKDQCDQLASLIVERITQDKS